MPDWLPGIILTARALAQPHKTALMLPNVHHASRSKPQRPMASSEAGILDVHRSWNPFLCYVKLHSDDHPRELTEDKEHATISLMLDPISFLQPTLPTIYHSCCLSVP